MSPNYNNARPETRVMIVDTIEQGRHHENQTTEDLPENIQRRLGRMRIIQSIIALIGLLLLIALAFIVTR